MEDSCKDNKIAHVNRVFLAEVIISLAATTVISFVYALIAGIIAKDDSHYDRLADKFIDLFENDLFSIVFSQFVLFLPVLIFILLHRKRFISNLRFKMLKLSTIALLGVLTFTLTPVLAFINSVSLLFSDNVINETVSGITSGNTVLVSVLAVALLPAVCEEVAYRGVFYSEYSKISPKKAILLSGLMFGMLHMNLNQFVYAAVMGMVFALIVEATDSILSTMIVHLLSNASSVMAMYAVSSDESVAVNEAESQTISEMFGEMAKEEGISPVMKDGLEYLSTLPEKYAQTIFLGVIAIIFGVISLVIFIQIAKNEGRYKSVKQILSFRKKRNADTDMYTGDNEQIADNIEQEREQKQRIVTPSLFIAFAISAFFMIYRQIKGI